MPATLTPRLPYTPKDLDRASRSIACHASQFTPESMKRIMLLTDRIHGGQMHLRSWSGGVPRADLFDR